MKLRALHLLALCLLFQSGLSQTVVKSLPGFPGDLPFYLETGYIGVGELEDVQLFYYFVESERSPKDDPLVLWLTGGPGCSALSGMLYEIGPFTFNYDNSTRYRPTLKLNDYSWTKWLKLHPEFLDNPLYIAGDSYSGIIVPMVTLQVVKGNKAGLEPEMNLEGYMLGNPLTMEYSDLNSRVPFAHLKGLISDELYESAKIDCNGDYINVNESNADCVDDLKAVTMCLEDLYTANILEPSCSSRVWCRNYNYMYSYIWASDRAVQDALHIREGTIEKWVRCNKTLSYTYTVTDVVDIHKELLETGFRALIYSGDHDMVIPYLGTQAWIDTLNLTISEDWHAWFVDGQVAGYATLYSYFPSLLTYATVKGAGHTAPEYKPKQCFELINRWFDYYYI
ncbi:hypothetical protein NL676_038991 [Syzygium grande]|nr:hypothetical protein NL676_038991 [Syzygium grande]